MPLRTVDWRPQEGICAHGIIWYDLRNPDMSSHGHRRLSTEEKSRVVLRVVRGESRDALAAELHVSADRIGSWEETFLSGGKAALAASRGRRWRGLPKLLGRIVPWSGLILFLFIVVYFLTRFFGAGAGEPASP
jgi:hypothetical protein